MNDIGGLYVEVLSKVGAVTANEVLTFVREDVVEAGYDPDGRATMGCWVEHGIVSRTVALWFRDKVR